MIDVIEGRGVVFRPDPIRLALYDIYEVIEALDANNHHPVNAAWVMSPGTERTLRELLGCGKPNPLLYFHGYRVITSRHVGKDIFLIDIGAALADQYGGRR